MNFNELAASFGKLSRRLDGVITKAEIEPGLVRLYDGTKIIIM